MDNLIEFLKQHREHARKDIVAAIQQMYAQERALFDCLFVLSEPVDASGLKHLRMVEPLKEVGLLSESVGLVNAAVTIIPLGNRLIMTDLQSNKDPRAIFPIYPETLYLLDHVPPHADSVLDIGTGSGIISVFAAATCGSVIAADINERALLFTMFNATLNGRRDKIKCRQTNLLTDLGEKYVECILVNLPFEPIPPGYSYFLHSDGGPDGLKLTRDFFEQINKKLLEFREIRMVTFSLGTSNHLILEDVIREGLHSSAFNVEMEILAPPMGFSVFAERFRDAKNFSTWHESTLGRGFDLLYFLGVRISPGRAFNCQISKNMKRDWGDWSNPVNWGHDCTSLPS